jgi:hypothetical protein
MDIDEIKSKKVSGDLVTVSKIIGITPDSVRSSLIKERSKHHKTVCAALATIIKNREMMISKLKQ